MKKMRLKNKDNSSLKILMPACLIMFILSAGLIYNSFKENEKTEEAISTIYKIGSELTGYAVYDETLLDYNKEEALVPVAQSEKRVIKNSIVAIYKNEEYETNLLRLEELDNAINDKLSALEETYSNDILIIEGQIQDAVDKSVTSNSYIDILDYKSKLDEYVYNKALTISSQSPSGSEITTLINEREDFRQAMNQSTNNVKAPLSGLVLYTVDGLENKFSVTEEINENYIEDIINEYNKEIVNHFGIKIVNNYEAYVVMKDTKENDVYATEGLYYDIELLDLDVTTRAKLEKKITTDENNYYIFKFINDIEDIVNLRKINLKVVFKKVEGFEVANSAITTINGVDYIKILSLNEYIDIPVKRLATLETISFVTNYSKTEKEELGIEETRNLLLYDRIIIPQD